MVEVKADLLEQSFEAFEQDDDGVAALKVELETLKAKIASGAIAAQRPLLDGVKSEDSTRFIDGYIRRGIDSGLELKAIESSAGAVGGYAVPQEIDAVIDATLKAISPIRSIANVVKVGSAGYRKLIADGGTPSGWVAYEAARPEGATPTGAWAGKARHIATMTVAGWRFLAPIDGLSAVIRSSGLRADYRSGAWETGIVRAERVEIAGEQVLSSQAVAIALPAGGTTIDAEARAVIDLVLAALRHHGLIAS